MTNNISSSGTTVMRYWSQIRSIKSPEQIFGRPTIVSHSGHLPPCPCLKAAFASQHSSFDSAYGMCKALSVRTTADLHHQVVSMYPPTSFFLPMTQSLAHLFDQDLLWGLHMPTSFVYIYMYICIRVCMLCVYVVSWEKHHPRDRDKEHSKERVVFMANCDT